MTAIPKRVELMYPSEYLKAADLMDKTPVLKLASIAQEELMQANRQKKLEWVAEFVWPESRPVEDQKRWVLCKTNTYRLSWHLGGEISDWLGKPFRLGVEQVSAQGGVRVPALRVVKDPKLQTPEGKAFCRTLVPNAWDRWWSL